MKKFICRVGTCLDDCLMLRERSYSWLYPVLFFVAVLREISVDYYTA